MLKTHPDAPTKCKALVDFELRGIWYRAGQDAEFRWLTADLLREAGKVRVLEDAANLGRAAK